MLNKVLCIEDSRIMQNIYRRLINGINFADEIITVYNGREAIEYYEELLRESRKDDPVYPDLIFLDLNMPVMGGWDFLEEFRDLYESSPIKPAIVIVTSSVDPEDQKRAREHPRILDLVSKPLTFESLRRLDNKLDGRPLNGDSS